MHYDICTIFITGNSIPKLLQQPQIHLKDPDTDAPDVFVVYFPDNEKHVRNVVRFVKQCRKYSIDATTDLFDPDSSQDRGFYIYAKLVESQFVFVVCSEMFFQYSETAYQKYESEKTNDGEIASFF